MGLIKLLKNWVLKPKKIKQEKDKDSGKSPYLDNVENLKFNISSNSVHGNWQYDFTPYNRLDLFLFPFRILFKRKAVIRSHDNIKLEKESKKIKKDKNTTSTTYSTSQSGGGTWNTNQNFSINFNGTYSTNVPDSNKEKEEDKD